MRSLHRLLSYAIVAATLLLLAAPAQAHELTEKRAKNALKPVAAELVPVVAPLIAQRLPGATVAKSGVGDCRIKKSHRAECAITFSIAGASTGETECGLEALVKFKNKRSRKLDIAVRGDLVCFFLVPPPGA